MKEMFPFYSIGHFINQPTNPTEFEITHFGEMEEPEVDDFHKHSFYEILWIEEGFSKQTIDYTEYELSSKTLFFISPNQVHMFEGWRGLVGGSIMFTEDFFLYNFTDKYKLFELSFLDCLYAKPYLQLTEPDFDEINSTIKLIAQEHKRANKKESIVRALLHVLLERIQRCVEKAEGKNMPAKSIVIYKQFKNLLEKNYVDNKTVTYYASELNLTQHHLNHVIRNLTGKTTTDLIRARSILEAKRLLTYTDLTISEVAAELNYFDSSYFSKIFKAETNSTPLDFKNLMSEKYRKR